MENYKNKIDVFNLYRKYGALGYIGEDISQYEHGMQAALLAEDFFNLNPSNISGDIILAAFLHDVGHLLRYESGFQGELMGNLGVMEHEKVGATFLKNLGYSDICCDLVEGHIMTKRYLISKNPKYYEKLSEASKKTYEYQGGNLNDIQMRDFEDNRLFEYHLKIREWDDLAKSTDEDLLNKISKIDLPIYFNLYL